MNTKQNIKSALKYFLLFGAISTMCRGCMIWNSTDVPQPSAQHVMLTGGERGATAP